MQRDKPLPKIICSSVIRSSNQGESHGGVYIVDLEEGGYKQVIDWNDESISWEGRGADRGLRGIAFYKDNVYLAASDEIFVYDKEFKLIESFRNKYLKHCHEIDIFKDRLYLTSTGYDSILEFDLNSKRFTRGYNISYSSIGLLLLKVIKKIQYSGFSPKPRLRIFNPEKNNGPIQKDNIHINNVFISEDKIFFSGTKFNSLFYVNHDMIKTYSIIPFGTHNVSLYKDYIIYNNTANDRIILQGIERKIVKSFEIIKYDKKELIKSDIPDDHARQAFGRGLCFTEGLMIGGSSPATISVYDIKNSKTIKTINITMDVRNSIHGLEIWPY